MKDKEIRELYKKKINLTEELKKINARIRELEPPKEVKSTGGCISVEVL